MSPCGTFQIGAMRLVLTFASPFYSASNALTFFQFPSSHLSPRKAPVSSWRLSVTPLSFLA